MPETTRMAWDWASAGIGVRPPAPEQRAQFFLVGAAKQPHRREIDRHAAADQYGDADHAVAGRAGEPVGEDGLDAVESDDHQDAGGELAQDPRGKPAFNPEMPATMEDDVEH